MEKILSVRSLTTLFQIGKKCYPVVDSLSFDLCKGKTMALVGESGCGKTMTARSLLRILPKPPALPPQGEVLYRGKNLLTLSEKEMLKVRGVKIGMIMQDPASALNPVYTIGEQLLEVVSFHLHLEGRIAKERVLATLDLVNFPNPRQRMEAYPHQLSGGLLQRAVIAMAILCEPDILIADEPTTALDVTIQAQILELLRYLQQEKGMAILLITHDMGVVAEMADSVIVMYARQKVEEASVEEIFDNPAHPYTQALFHSRPTHARKAGRLPLIAGSVPPLDAPLMGCHFSNRCPEAMSLCQQGLVPFFPLPRNPHHTARCWLYDKQLELKMHEPIGS